MIQNKIKQNALLFLLACCYLSACAGSKNLIDLPFNIEGNLDMIPDEFEQEIQKENLPFKDKTIDYGLNGIKANNINIVDLNGDNYSDIVIIPSFYDYPIFYYFDIHQKKFIKGESPFKVTPRVSYMLFYDLNGDNITDVLTGVLNQQSELSREPLRVFYGKKHNHPKLEFIESKNSTRPTPSSTVNLVDFNMDGKLDLFIGNWFEK